MTNQKALVDVLPLLSIGNLHSHILVRLPLEQAADAYRIVEDGQHLGKIVLHLTRWASRP